MLSRQLCFLCTVTVGMQRSVFNVQPRLFCVSSVQCSVFSIQCQMFSVDCGSWSVERRHLRGREPTVSSKTRFIATHGIQSSAGMENRKLLKRAIGCTLSTHKYSSLQNQLYCRGAGQGGGAKKGLRTMSVASLCFS